MQQDLEKFLDIILVVSKSVLWFYKIIRRKFGWSRGLRKTRTFWNLRKKVFKAYTYCQRSFYQCYHDTIFLDQEKIIGEREGNSKVTELTSLSLESKVEDLSLQ